MSYQGARDALKANGEPKTPCRNMPTRPCMTYMAGVIIPRLSDLCKRHQQDAIAVTTGGTVFVS